MRRPPTRPKMRTWRFMMGCEEVYRLQRAPFDADVLPRPAPRDLVDQRLTRLLS